MLRWGLGEGRVMWMGGGGKYFQCCSNICAGFRGLAPKQLIPALQRPCAFLIEARPRGTQGRRRADGRSPSRGGTAESRRWWSVMPARIPHTLWHRHLPSVTPTAQVAEFDCVASPPESRLPDIRPSNVMYVLPTQQPPPPPSLPTPNHTLALKL